MEPTQGERSPTDEIVGGVGYRTSSFAGIAVCYTDTLIGGGERYGQDFVAQVRQRFGEVERVFEWCAGPGFIGFSLLARGLCRSLCLADVNPAAVAACEGTIQLNRLAGRVTVYLSDCLDAIPTDEQWDLVVGNPPHSGTSRPFPWGPSLIYMDADWELHRRFYGGVARFLKPGASVLIQENSDLSSAATFRPMIEAGGLELRERFPCSVDPHIYYILSTLDGSR